MVKIKSLIMKTYKVTMNLSEEEVELVQSLKGKLNMPTNTGSVALSLRIADMIATGLKSGKELAFLDKDGKPETKILIPGVSRKI